MTVVAIGKNSFLAQNVRRHPGARDWLWLSHHDAESDPALFAKASCVVNFAFAPELQTGDYDAELDIDSKIARCLPQTCRYVMLSTRMVYGAGNAQRGFRETDELKPENFYGRNKKIVEENLRRIIAPENFTILRLSNIFGFEPGRHTFFGAALKNLAERKQIVFDISLDSVRDFLPVSIFAEHLVAAVSEGASGAYNIGCGFPVECGQIAEWIIEGYGDGEIVCTDNSRRGEFFLDTTKSLAHIKLPAVTIDDVRAACVSCGQQLRASNA